MLEGPTRYPSIVKKSGISIIGAGRIGRALGRRLRQQGWKIHSVVTRALGGQPLLMAAPLKPLYHAAAAISAGHVLALQESAIRIFISLGMKRQEALKAALPLTRQVLENLEHVGPRAAWTGPLARADYPVIALHEEALQPLPLEYLDAYRAVNRLAARLLARDSEPVLRELATISSKTFSQSKSIGPTA